MQDDFDDGNYDGWTVSSGTWSVVSGELHQTSESFARIYRGSTSWDNYEVSFSYKSEDDGGQGGDRVGMYFREYDGNNKYFASFAPGEARLQRKLNGIWATLTYNPYVDTELSTWYDVRVVADGSTLKVYRDGEEILSATDSDITAGRVALTCDGNSDAYFDDVLVTSLADPVTTTYEYNTANELTKQTKQGTDTNFYYDVWGRMTSKAQGSYSATYAYRYGDKLVSITSNFPGEGNVWYKYGGDGKRRERTDASTYIWYNWDAGWNVISEEDSGGGLQMTYVNDPGKVVGTILAHIEGSNPSTGTYRYYFQDVIGSTRRVRNVDGSSYASYEYTPYGQVYDHSGSDVRHRFTGQEWDDTAELYYFPFRYYSPAVARWMIREPLGLNGPNLYWYALANPTSFKDLLGLESDNGSCGEEAGDDWPYPNYYDGHGNLYITIHSTQGNTPEVAPPAPEGPQGPGWPTVAAIAGLVLGALEVGGAFMEAGGIIAEAGTIGAVLGGVGLSTLGLGILVGGVALGFYIWSQHKRTSGRI